MKREFPVVNEDLHRLSEEFNDVYSRYTQDKLKNGDYIRIQRIYDSLYGHKAKLNTNYLYKDVWRRISLLITELKLKHNQFIFSNIVAPEDEQNVTNDMILLEAYRAYYNYHMHLISEISQRVYNIKNKVVAINDRAKYIVLSKLVEQINNEIKNVAPENQEILTIYQTLLSDIAEINLLLRFDKFS
jgi:hypothetical protein